MFGFGLSLGFGFNPIGTESNQTESLFNSPQNLLFDKASLWIPSFEAEIYEYIKKNPNIIYQLPPRKYEELIASVFKNQGFDVELTPEIKDGGYDVLAVQKNSLSGDKKYLVECKRYAAENKVGVGITRSLLGDVVDQNAYKGILATTSFFTAGALEFEERNKKLLSLQDYNNFLDWLNQNSINDSFNSLKDVA